MTNATEIAKPFKRTNPGHIDLLYGPYNSLAEACREVPNATKEVDGVEKNFRAGQVIGLNTPDGIVEYWWPNNTDDTDLVVKSVNVSELATKEEANNKIPIFQRGAPLGVATLDKNGKIEASQLNITGFRYMGQWDPIMNLPEITPNSNIPGDTFYISVPGSRDLGFGIQDFKYGQRIVFNGSNWDQMDEEEAAPETDNDIFDI